ncbi:MAG: AzlC family ABC transporter permease [Paracoccaceae bacterium]
MDGSRRPPETPPRVRVRPSARGFREGLVATLPLLLAVGPFGLLFGVIATKAGLALSETMAMTALVIAGASQLAALQVLADGAPAAIAVLTGAIVNLRMAMYSASLAVYWRDVPLGWRALAAAVLHDQDYALSIARYRTREESLDDRLGFYFGVGCLTCGTWVSMSLVGATLGQHLPEEIDLSVIAPITFIALVAPMLRGRAVLLAATVASAVSLALVALPWGLGMMIGAVAGIAAGMGAGGGR